MKPIAYAAVLWIARPIRDAYRSLRGTHPVRVFTFHRIGDHPRDGMTVVESTFREQIEYIAATHAVLELDAAMELLRSRSRLSRPVAVLTFDDAYSSVYDTAAPHLAELGLPACCFVPTDFIDTGRTYDWDKALRATESASTMSWRQLDELTRAGWTIGGHTAGHVRLAECEPEQVILQLAEPREILKDRLRLERLPMAYPFGGPDDVGEQVPEFARQAGYTAAFFNYGGENRPQDSLFHLRRIDIGGNHPTLAWKAHVHGFERAARRPGRRRR